MMVGKEKWWEMSSEQWVEWIWRWAIQVALQRRTHSSAVGVQSAAGLQLSALQGQPQLQRVSLSEVLFPGPPAGSKGPLVTLAWQETH